MGGKKNVLLKRGRVNSRGYLAVSYRARRSKVFGAVFTGDVRYRPRTVTRTVGVRARVTTKSTGYYTTVRYGRTTYHTYHHTAKLKEAITVIPNKHGQCVKLQVQMFYNGSGTATSPPVAAT